MTITSLNIQDGSYKERRCTRRIKKRHVVILLVIIIIIITVTVYMLTKQSSSINDQSDLNLFPPNPNETLPPSSSKLRSFQKAAISSDSIICSDIGVNILEKNGSAVDATLATMFCNGLLTMQSMGIGGGFLMTLYSKEENKVYTLNAREAAPLAAKEDMFSKDPMKAKIGPLAIGVPGELKGYIAAHDKFGKLPWEELIQPTIELCKIGFNVSKHQANALKIAKKGIKTDALLSKLFVDDKSNLKSFGDIIKHEKYCETLQLISNNKNDFYNGSLADLLVKDIQEQGGIITKEDLETYEALWEEPVAIKLKDNTFYSVPSPGNGNILGFILNILQGYNFTKESTQGTNNTILTYHRIIEAFKYAYAKRSYLGDPNFVNITEVVEELSNSDLAEEIRNKILDDQTSDDPLYYGALSINKKDHGTAHISVLAPNGDAVSVTSTINLYFGASIMSKNTGILLNSGMDDFSSNGFKNYFGLPYAPANKISPGKRSLSSMSPSIILDKDNNVKLVIGAAGGTKIPSSLALVIMKSLWLGDDLKEAIDAPRFHNQIFPMEVSYEYGVLQDIVEGLHKKGHKIVRSLSTGSVINAILRENNTVFANADYRKGGEASGF